MNKMRQANWVWQTEHIFSEWQTNLAKFSDFRVGETERQIFFAVSCGSATFRLVQNVWSNQPWDPISVDRCSLFRGIALCYAKEIGNPKYWSL